MQDLRRGRAQLKAFLLRNGYRYTGKSAWTEAHRRYLRELVLPHPAQRVVLEDAIRAIGTAEERIGRLEDQMHALLESWPMRHCSPTLPAPASPLRRLGGEVRNERNHRDPSVTASAPEAARERSSSFSRRLRGAAAVFCLPVVALVPRFTTRLSSHHPPGD